RAVLPFRQLPQQDSPSPKLTVLATCTLGKTIPPEPVLTARTLESQPVEGRLEEWLIRVHEADSPSIPALDLYKGDYWATVRKIREDVPSDQSPLLALKVISAGFGLVDESSSIKPYAATFSVASPDCV